jgi:hypothetical protein
MQGAFATAAAHDGSVDFGSEDGSGELHSAAHSDVDCEVHSEGADVSPAAAAGGYGYTAGSPTYSQHSSAWSSPVGNREVQGELMTPRQGWQQQQQQQQQPGMPPLSPGLSLAELSTGAPIDLEGSEADSDLLESNVMSPAWQAAAAAARPAYDADVGSESPTSAAAQPQQLVGSLMPCGSSSGSSVISSSYCASDADEEEVERTAFVEYTNPAAAGAEPQLIPAPQPVQQQWQQQQQDLALELDGGASWLRSSEGGEGDDDGGYLDDGRASFDSDDELPVMRMQGGEQT